MIVLFPMPSVVQFILIIPDNIIMGEILFLAVKPKREREHFKGLDMDGCIILKCILNK